jgi:hypothetical protein
MRFKRVFLIATLGLLVMPLATAQAGWRIGIGIGLPFYRPYPYRVYVAPAPIYIGPPAYVQPAPVYVQPAPVYVQPAPTPTALPPAPVPPNLPPQPVPVSP